MGFGTLEQVLGWCEQLGIRVVSVYAFSIDNFSRIASEVEEIMRLAQVQFDKIAQSG